MSEVEAMVKVPSGDTRSIFDFRGGPPLPLEYDRGSIDQVSSPFFQEPVTQMALAKSRSGGSQEGRLGWKPVVSLPLTDLGLGTANTSLGHRCSAHSPFVARLVCIVPKNDPWRLKWIAKTRYSLTSRWHEDFCSKSTVSRTTAVGLQRKVGGQSMSIPMDGAKTEHGTMAGCTAVWPRPAVTSLPGLEGHASFRAYLAEMLFTVRCRDWILLMDQPEYFRAFVRCFRCLLIRIANVSDR